MTNDEAMAAKALEDICDAAFTDDGMLIDTQQGILCDLIRAVRAESCAEATAARAESEAALGLLRDEWDEMVRERDAYREKAARPMSHAVMTLDRCDRCGWPMAVDGCAPGRCIAPDLRRVREEVWR